MAKVFVNYGLAAYQCARTFTRVLQDGIAPFGITAGEFRVLRIIETAPMIQAEIAQLAAMDRPFVAVLLKKLGAKGFVSSRPHRTDRRRVDVFVTASGRRTLDRITEEIIMKSNGVATRGISVADLQTFADVSRRLVANLDAGYFADRRDEA